MAKVLSVVEYKEEGIAVVEDTIGKYLISKHSDAIVPLPEPKVDNYFASRQQCALLQSRERMLT